VLVSVANFSGTCRRFLPRGNGSRPHELDQEPSGRLSVVGSGPEMHQSSRQDSGKTRRRYNTVQYTAGVGWHLLARQHKTPGPCMETNGVRRWVAPLEDWVHVILQAHTTHAE
jgi:hypothetical protein